MNKNLKRLLLLVFSVVLLPTMLIGKGLKMNEYALLAKDERSVVSATFTGVELFQENTTKSFHVVIMGPVVKDIHLNVELLEIMKNGTEHGIKYVFCEIALERFGLSKEDLPDYLSTTPNAHTYILSLMKQGFYTLTI